LLGLLSATTPSGRLYSIDSRLRPNGKSGLLVSSVDAFSRYQAKQAWVWELQALTRARPVAGNTGIAENFDAIRLQVLTAARDKDQLRQEVLEMRKRLRDELDDSASLKHGRGGLVDIQFVVQLGLLLNAEKFPAILGSTELIEQLQSLHECHWINGAALDTFIKAYTKLGHEQQRSSLIDDTTNIETAGLLDIAHALCDEILR